MQSPQRNLAALHARIILYLALPELWQQRSRLHADFILPVGLSDRDVRHLLGKLKFCAFEIEIENIAKSYDIR